MRTRHRPLPRIWLMTDERMGDGLWEALEALPKGSGVVLRHYSLARRERAELQRKVARIAGRRRLFLLAGGRDHGRGRGAISAPVHTVAERIAAERAGVRLIFVSPVYPTRSHPGGRALGRVRFGMLVRGAQARVIALGGMDGRRARALSAFKIHGWAGIDAFMRQKRKAVPT